jgi:hypothetical protein
MRYRRFGKAILYVSGLSELNGQLAKPLPTACNDQYDRYVTRRKKDSFLMAVIVNTIVFWYNRHKRILA